MARAHFRQPIGFRVAMIGRILRRRQQPVDNRRRRRNIGVADAKGDYIRPPAARLAAMILEISTKG